MHKSLPIVINVCVIRGEIPANNIGVTGHPVVKLTKDPHDIDGSLWPVRDRFRAVE